AEFDKKSGNEQTLDTSSRWMKTHDTFDKAGKLSTHDEESLTNGVKRHEEHDPKTGKETLSKTTFRNGFTQVFESDGKGNLIRVEEDMPDQYHKRTMYENNKAREVDTTWKDGTYDHKVLNPNGTTSWHETNHKDN